MNTWKDKKEFKSCVHEYAGKMKIEVKALALRPMKNKWASCSTDGNLNFNSELLDIEKELGEYVIVHELLHFKIPNHGKLWKSLMSAYLGDWEMLDKRLKEKNSTSVVTSPDEKNGQVLKKKRRLKKT
ncbi:MAG: M48 family metallopeptidase [Candidatus Kuenenia sp.]|nr:M48 family metallopeptidase [Candidatus Kuenenia hertensis]